MAEEEDKQEFVQSLTAKEIKKLARPEFAANPDKFYPTATLKKMGYERTTCPTCKNNFWRHTPTRITCGDSQCEQSYGFIGRGTGVGRGAKGKKITYAEAWESFRKSFTSARIPCTAIPRYPVVARWRADVDYVAAGIFCFQPYCVTGELEPPANPLICPQFCLRFNDLDNIGLTGRHYSGFIMLGIQVFNSKDNYKFWSAECVEFNFKWLTEELKINPDEITFIEDVWAGGGNLGPSIEYFVSGLELGNMVFMQFKTFPDGSREPLQVQVIDVGIGLERVPWLINGTPTSYFDVFPRALKFLLEKIEVSIEVDIWEKFGPYSCLLNVDEVEDIDKTWKWIGEKVGVDANKVKKAIEPIKEIYVILDHTRSVLMAITDGSLPSNVGGASNIRNILRRSFALLTKNGWWEKLTMQGFLELFVHHKADLATIYGEFPPYPSFNPIIELEYERWSTTDTAMQEKLQKLVNKKKGGKLDLDDWIVCVTSWGLTVEMVAQFSKQEVPGNLYYSIAERQERSVKAAPTVLYSTAHLKETESLYYHDHLNYEFTAKIVEVFPNVTKKNEPSIIILDQSAFYPTSGGQDHDNGWLWVDGKQYEVVDCLKVGPCVLHVIEPPLPANKKLEQWKGVAVKGKVDSDRRDQLRNNHTATHIVYASCRKVLGPHVWQNGAKKSVSQAHLDITHFKSLTSEQVLAIQTEANRIVHRCKQITKGFMPKDIAEKKYGFHLYQGGVVPGNELRVVNISDTDTEACCGTHADNTAEVGTIKIIKTGRVSDGIVRLYFVAGERALEVINEETSTLQALCTSWGVGGKEIVSTAERFFDGFKKLTARSSKQDQKLLDLQLRLHCVDPKVKLMLQRSDQSNPTLYISNCPAYLEDLQKTKKGVVFVGDTFLYGLLGDSKLFDTKGLQGLLDDVFKEESKKPDIKVKPMKLVTKTEVSVKGQAKGDKPKKITGVSEFSCFTIPGPQYALRFLDLFTKAGFTLQD